MKVFKIDFSKSLPITNILSTFYTLPFLQFSQ
jgi:hypothetical protein